MDAVFLLPGHPGVAEIARAAGVRRIVRLSGSSAGSGDMSNAITRYMAESEAEVRATGLQWTTVRPTAYMSNTLRWLPQLCHGDTVELPFADVPIVCVDPAILYFGTPVALISTLSALGEPNLMPMSSVFWLGHTAILGISNRSQTSQNLRDTGECAISLPSADLVSQVNELALTTGRNPVPGGKADVGYQYVADKFARARLTPVESEAVAPWRIAECAVALEGTVSDVYELEKHDPREAGSAIAAEVRIARVHVRDSIRVPGYRNRIDPDLWRPLIMSFQRFYGLSPELHPDWAASTRTGIGDGGTRTAANLRRAGR